MYASHGQFVATLLGIWPVLLDFPRAETSRRSLHLVSSDVNAIVIHGNASDPTSRFSHWPPPYSRTRRTGLLDIPARQ